MKKEKCKKNTVLKSGFPLMITGLLVGAIVGGMDQSVIIGLTMILYTLGAFSMVVKFRVCKYIVGIFLAGYLIFLYQTIQLLTVGEVTIPELWYLLDGLVGLFAYVSAHKLKNN